MRKDMQQAIFRAQTDNHYPDYLPKVEVQIMSQNTLESKPEYLHEVEVYCPQCGSRHVVRVSTREWPKCTNCECEMQRVEK